MGGWVVIVERWEGTSYSKGGKVLLCIYQQTLLYLRHDLSWIWVATSTL